MSALLPVLLVDDDDDVHLLFHATLRRSSLRGRLAIRTAGDGLEALALIEEFSPALIVADVHMPHMDGPALVQALRARGDQTPIVLMGALPAAAPPGVFVIDKSHVFDDLAGALSPFLPR